MRSPRVAVDCCRHRTLLVHLALGLAATAGGCSKKSAPKVETTSLVRFETRAVLERAGATVLPGARAIAARVLDAQSVAVLIDGGGPRFVSWGEASVIEVCSTAESLSATAKALAVGCAGIGTAAPQVLRIDVATKSVRTISMPDPGPTSPTEASWPVVNHALDGAAMATARGVTIIGLDDDASASQRPTSHRDSEVVDVVYSRDDAQLALAHQDGVLELFDLASQAAPRLFKPETPDRDPRIAFSPSGTQLASASFWGQFSLYAIDGALLHHDVAASGRYGHSGVAFVGGRNILQIEAGDVVLRTLEGARLDAASSDGGNGGMFGPGLAGGVGFVASASDNRVVTISADGQSTSVVRLRDSP